MSALGSINSRPSHSLHNNIPSVTPKNEAIRNNFNTSPFIPTSKLQASLNNLSGQNLNQIGLPTTIASQGIKRSEGVSGAKGSTSYANHYINSGKQWLGAADALRQTSPSGFENLVKQYQQSNTPITTELGKILVHTGLIPQRNDTARMSLPALQHHKSNMISGLEAKGWKSMEVGNAIHYQKHQPGGMEPEIKALDTGITSDLNEQQLHNVIDIQAAMGQITPEEAGAAHRNIFNTTGQMLSTTLQAVDLATLKSISKSLPSSKTAAYYRNSPGRASGGLNLPDVNGKW